MAKKAKKMESKEKVTTVYIGKSLPGLPQYKVFKDGILPEHIRQMAEKNTNIYGLIVPVARLQEARRDINIKGHILNYYAEQLNNKEA